MSESSNFNGTVNKIFNSFTTTKVIAPVYKPPKGSDLDTLKFKNYIENKRMVDPKKVVNNKKPNVFFQEREKFINITSDSNQFIVDISKDNFTNVISIELIGSKFNNINNGNDIFIQSELLGGDFSISNVASSNIFSQIQLSGDNDTSKVFFNSYVGGKKVFYNDSVKSTINIIDIGLIDIDEFYVEIPDNMTWNIILKVTELIKKVENSDYNSNIGFSFNNTRSTDIHTHIFDRT